MTSPKSATRVLRSIAGLVGGIALLVGATPALAGAADNGSFGVNPAGGSASEPRSYFIYNLDPGSNIEDAVVVSNSTDAPLTFRLYAADASPAADGVFALGRPEDTATGVGSWILLPTDQITVPANTQANIPFRLIVPSNALPGDHAGGIVAIDTNVTRAPDQDGLAIGTQNSVGTRIYVRVAGATQPGIDVAAVSLSTEGSPGSLFGGSSKATITYKVVNTGNVRLAPTVTAEVKGLFGFGGTTLPPRELPELLPGSSATITEDVDTGPTLGLHTATVSVSALAGDGTTVTSSGSARNIALPWGLLAVLVLLGIAVVLVARRPRRQAETPEAEPVARV